MSKESYLLKLPASEKAGAARLAKEDGVVETAADFLKRRSGGARRQDMLPFLKRARREVPPAGDEI